MKTIIKYIFYFNLSIASLLYATENSFFVSLRSNEVNLRNGPGNEYPIKYIYKIKSMPIKVVGEYEGWYKIIDKDNDEGWVSKNLTIKKRHIIIKNGTQIMYKKNNLKSVPIFRLEENVVAELGKCSQNWCKIKIRDKTGWVQSENIWGI